MYAEQINKKLLVLVILFPQNIICTILNMYMHFFEAGKKEVELLPCKTKYDVMQAMLTVKKKCLQEDQNGLFCQGCLMLIHF